MKRQHPPHGLIQWIEFYWLILTSRAFRAAPDKRKAYFEHCVAKSFRYRCW